MEPEDCHRSAGAALVESFCSCPISAETLISSAVLSELDATVWAKPDTVMEANAKKCRLRTRLMRNYVIVSRQFLPDPIQHR